MAPLYKKALIVGATSGIGAALAAKLLTEGTSVIVAGRRRDRLEAFVSRHGNSATNNNNATVSSAVVDVLCLEDIPAFAASVVRAHPDLDCVVLTRGSSAPTTSPIRPPSTSPAPSPTSSPPTTSPPCA